MACPLAGQADCPKMAAAAVAAAPNAMLLFELARGEAQPLREIATRLVAAFDYLRCPLAADDKAAIAAAVKNTNDVEAAEAVQRVLDPHCLALIHINPESRVKVHRASAPARLVEGGWSVFPLKIHNEAGVTAQLRGKSPNATSTLDSSPSSRDRWMKIEMFDTKSIPQKLSGASVDYRVVKIYSRDAGKREAKLLFDVGQGTQDIGFRNELDVLFTCRKASKPDSLHAQDDCRQPCKATRKISPQVTRPQAAPHGKETTVMATASQSSRAARVVSLSSKTGAGSAADRTEILPSPCIYC